MKKWIITALLGLSFSAAFAQIRDADRIVAVVDNDIITLTELNTRVTETKAQAAQAGASAKLPADDVLKAQVLEQMINERILIQYAQNTGIRVSDTEIDQAIANLAQQSKVSTEEFYKTLEKKRRKPRPPSPRYFG